MAKPTFTDWIAAQLGTRKWVVFARLTQRLRDKGYEKAVTPKRYRELMRQFETETGHDFFGRKIEA